MDYKHIWKKLLGDDEKIEYQFSIGNKYTTLGLILWEIIPLSLIFINFWLSIFLFVLIIFYQKYYIPAANVYAFTNKRILIHEGWLSTYAASIDYSKITDIRVSEPFFDRIITNTGHLEIYNKSSK